MPTEFSAAGYTDMSLVLEMLHKDHISADRQHANRCNPQQLVQLFMFWKNLQSIQPSAHFKLT